MSGLTLFMIIGPIAMGGMVYVATDKADLIALR